MNETTICNIAFFDAEFTALSEKDRGVQEMIQCALIICQGKLSCDNKLIEMSDKPVFTYDTFVKPIYNTSLSDYIKELTGISQEDVDAGKSFCGTMDDLYMAIKQHRVRQIFTWGPDQILLKRNCDILNCNRYKSRYVRCKIRDVSMEISDFFGYKNAISQHKVCQMLNIPEIGEQHNAYCDASNLSQVIKEFCGQISL